MTRLVAFALAVIVVFNACKTATVNAGLPQPQVARIAFYNVENLFDTIDHPVILDEEFTPNSEKQWTEARYQTKLEHISYVIEGMQFPELMGLSEVENKGVLEDLCKKTMLSGKDYGIVHYDSPDIRGIDVAFIYQNKAFTVASSSTKTIDFPKEIVEDYTTRDILKIEGKLYGTDVIVFVNHWPSRYGGVRESEPKRLYVAQQLRSMIDEVFAANAKANVIILGDLNDETDNKSVAEVLRAGTATANATDLYNCMAELDQANKGSYNYRGNWNMLDQIIVSNGLKSGAAGWKVTNAGIYSRKWMMYEDKKYGFRPSRTYGGPRYFGGFSDHLPVFVDLLPQSQ